MDICVEKELTVDDKRLVQLTHQVGKDHPPGIEYSPGGGISLTRALPQVVYRSLNL